MVLRMPIVFMSELPALVLERVSQPLLAHLRSIAAQYQEHSRRSRDRAELAQMSSGELNDLGIARGDIPALMDAPAAWRRDRV